MFPTSLRLGAASTALIASLVLAHATRAQSDAPASPSGSKSPADTAATFAPTILTLSQVRNLQQAPQGAVFIYLSESEWSQAMKGTELSKKPPEGTLVINAISDSRGGVILVPTVPASMRKKYQAMARLEPGGLIFYTAPISPRDARELPVESPAIVDACQWRLGKDGYSCVGRCAPRDVLRCRPFFDRRGDWQRSSAPAARPGEAE